jgi:tetratricopeptide (TPR) repeat protein
MAASEKPGKGNRIFISTVSNEFKTCREQLALDLRFPDVDVQTQEQNITQLAAGQTILIKLDDYIAQCDAVIHLIGQQTSTDGSPASKAAVDDLLGRHADLPGVVGLGEAELRTLSYTQWEAWLALYHRKTKRHDLLLIIATPTAAFVPDHPADAATAHAQKLSQAWHEKELQQRGHYSEISFEDPKDLSIAILRALKDILPAQQPQQRLAQTRLISRHTAADFLGRDKELDLLDDAWTGPRTTNILSVIAWGGVGKTALLAYWVRSRFIEHDWKDRGQFAKSVADIPVCTPDANHADKNVCNTPALDAYFDWTFYDQGTRSDDATHAGAASVGTFFQSALRHFGDPDPESPHDKAARLARLIQAQRSLLVLDGLEPLQYPLHHPQVGQLTDPDLRELLGLLAQRNPGLVIISSRQALTDFTCGAATPTRQHDLEELPVECAVALLRQMQIIGTDEELQQAATDYACHALSLIVLGRFLFVKGGDINLRSQIPLEIANENRNQRITRNAWHVLEAYEQWLASPAGNPADVQALRLTGLFDRPASPDCLAALRAAPAIPGLTDQLVPLSADAWNAVLHRLHEAHLLQLRFPPVDAGSFAPRPEAREVTVDVHPLIREYFAKHLREKQAEGFQAAHSRLFDHLCARTEPRPATLEALQPLYQAVVHGCLAGRQQEAVEKVFRDRILRGGDAYSTKQLGAIGADLGAVAAFFEEPWSRLSANLSAADQAWLLNEAAYRLRALGRLTEAVEPMRVALKMGVAAENWKSAAVRASNLSELEVTVGRVEEALADARRSIEFADRDGEWSQRMINRTTAADALHQSGEREEARRLLEQAEALQRERQPVFDLLYGLAGFRYCDLILAPAERAAWQR